MAGFGNSTDSLVGVPVVIKSEALEGVAMRRYEFNAHESTRKSTAELFERFLSFLKYQAVTQQA